MIDQVHGRELPPMENWSTAVLDEAIHCKVQFGVLVLGQGMVTARLVSARPGSKLAVVRVTYDPRNVMVGVNYTAEMRYISEIRHPANTFSLMKPIDMAAHKAETMRAARRLLARAKTQAGGYGQGGAKAPVRARGTPTQRVIRVANETPRQV